MTLGFHAHPRERAAALLASASLVGLGLAVAVTPLFAAPQPSGSTSGVRPSIKGSGTTNFLAQWTSPTKLGNAPLFAVGSAPNAKLGLNTKSPNATFDISAPNQVGLFVEGPASGVGSGLDLRTSGSGAHQWEVLATGSAAAQGTNKLNVRDVNVGGDRLTIDSSGHIGIGNTAPAAMLDVTAPNQTGLFLKAPFSGIGSGLDLFTTGNGGRQWEVLATGQQADPNQGIGSFNIRDVATKTDFFTIRTDGAPAFVHIGSDLAVDGLVFTLGSCSGGCLRTQRVRSYVPRAAAPVSEDFGSAQLVNGRATVNLDPTFVAGMERGRPYLVFVTPQGDSEGLYVAHKSPTSFAIAEMHAGRHTLAFDYRIVAQVAGGAGRRMAIVDRASARR